MAAKGTKRRSRRHGRLPYTQRHGSGWRGWWMENGRRRYTRVYRTEEEAHEEAKRRRGQESDLKRRGRMDLKGGTELVMVYLSEEGRKNGTLRFYRGCFGIILKHFAGKSPLAEFTRDHIEHYIRKRRDDGIAANTIRHEVQVFSRIFNVAKKEGFVSHNPVDGARRPQAEDTKIDVFEWNDARDIIDTVREAYGIRRVDTQRDADLLTLVLYTGMRRAEVARLSEGDFDGERLEVEGKTGGRVLPVPAQLGEVLNRLRIGDRFVPGETEDKRIDWVHRTFVRWRKRLGEGRLHAHAFRHTFASELAKRGIAEHVLADLLGHARRRTSITSRYVSVFGPEYVAAMGCLWQDSPRPKR